jgi:hypothetical protein
MLPIGSEELREALCPQKRYRTNSDFDWFPDLDNVAAEQAARGVCSRCPVQYDCAQTALDQREAWGIWGGMEEFRMRRALGLDSRGENRVYHNDLRCPFCDSDDLAIAKKKGVRGYPVECNYCGIRWTSYRIPAKIRKTLKRRHDTNLASGVVHAGGEGEPQQA